MHDIKAIKRDPEAFDRAMRRRGAEVRAKDLLALDEARVANTQAMNDAQASQKAASKRIGALMGRGAQAGADAAKAEVAGLKDEVKRLEEAQRGLDAKLREALLPIPNTLADDVPDGADEAGNVEVHPRGMGADVAAGWKAGYVPGPLADVSEPKDHVALGEALGMMDFEAAARLSGSRFVVLKRDLARLERALATFMLTLHTENGYEEVSPPVVVNRDPLIGTGQLPKFEDDQFKAVRYQDEGDPQYLSPTAEVTLTNLVRESILSKAELPRRMTAWTQCFRAEAGSAGRDTRGMIRMHQFSKVELVSITTPEQSEEEHERMTGCAEEALKRLDLPFRTMLLCAGDTGFSAAKTYDLEVWLPGQDQYREISSCSNTCAFQARRMDARYKGEGMKKPDFVHTLNGSGLAVGRTLVAVIENYQNPDGSISVPDALRPLMGEDRIEAA